MGPLFPQGPRNRGSTPARESPRAAHVQHRAPQRCCQPCRARAAGPGKGVVAVCLCGRGRAGGSEKRAPGCSPRVRVPGQRPFHLRRWPEARGPPLRRVKGGTRAEPGRLWLLPKRPLPAAGSEVQAGAPRRPCARGLLTDASHGSDSIGTSNRAQSSQRISQGGNLQSRCHGCLRSHGAFPVSPSSGFDACTSRCGGRTSAAAGGAAARRGDHGSAEGGGFGCGGSSDGSDPARSRVRFAVWAMVGVGLSSGMWKALLQTRTHQAALSLTDGSSGEVAADGRTA